MSARAADGFTLVETLVTLVLLGLMSALTVGVFQQLRAAKALEVRYQRQTEIEAAIAYVAGEIGRAMPIPLREQGDIIPQPMIGTTDSIRFVGVTRDGFGTDALREIQFFVNNQQGTNSLIRKVRSRANSSEFINVIIENVKEFEIEYADRSQQTKNYDEWKDRDELPSAISFTISLNDSTAKTRIVLFEDQ